MNHTKIVCRHDVAQLKARTERAHIHNALLKYLREKQRNFPPYPMIGPLKQNTFLF